MPTRSHHAFRLAALLLTAVFALLTACAPSEEEVAVDREAIRQTLMDYLPLMAEAYATGDVEPLVGKATQKERAILDKNVRDLASQGRTVRTELRELTIEEIDMVSYGTAYVTTLEEWQVRVYASGTENVLGEDADQVNRVHYQLQREGDGWLVMSRNSSQVAD